MARASGQRFPPPPGWSSKGERIRDENGNPVGLGLIQGEGDPIMAKTSADDVVARGADVPLALATNAAPRDALVDPQPGDIIPDVETKGYHVGTVRQPAEPVLTRGGEVKFESLGDTGESKFASSYAEEQAALDERLSSDPAYAGTPYIEVHADPEKAEAAYKQRLADQPAPRTRSTGSGATEKLDADSAKVARAQAADDKS